MSHNPTAISPPSVSDSTIDDLAELVKIEENLVIAQDDQPFIDQNQALNSSLQNTYTTVDDDPDDPIVHRIPVFLSQELANELYLVQYPLRPADRPYTDVGPLVEASIKEKQRRLTMSFTVDQAGPHYDHDADYDMPLLKLSSYPVPPKTNFAAGIYRNERIYLTPLHATVRMLPSLDHIDDALDEERIETERRKNGGLPPTKDDDDDMAPVMLRFKRQGTVDGISARRITYQYLQTLKDNEPWQPIAIHDDQDDLNAMHVASDAERIKNRLGLVPQHNVQFPLSAAEYLRYVNDPDTVFGDSDIPIEYLGSKTPLEQRLSHLLLSAKVVSFGQICQKLQIRTPAEVTQVLSLLINTTFLIHGNFVYKSESIYNLKAFRGFYKTVLCRNIVLAFFARNYTVNRKDIVNVVSVDEATLTELLEELAVRVGETEMWNFKLPIDNQFIQHFPDYVAIEGEKPYKLYDHTLFLLNPSR